MDRLYNYIGPAMEKSKTKKQTKRASLRAAVRLSAVWKWTCGRPGLSVLTMSLTVSVDVKQHLTMLRHWSQPVSSHPSMATDIPEDMKLYIVESSSTWNGAPAARPPTQAPPLTRAARRLGLLRKLEQAIKFQTDDDELMLNVLRCQLTY